MRVENNDRRLCDAHVLHIQSGFVTTGYCADTGTGALCKLQWYCQEYGEGAVRIGEGE